MNNYLNIAKEAGYIGSAIALSFWRKPIETHSKSTWRDLVTEADVAIDTAIRAFLQKQVPTHAVVSEEIDQTLLEAQEYTWVIDPIDGTVNFSMGSPIFGISIALLQYGKPLLGVIIFPAFDELYWAERGQGAWIQRKEEAAVQCHASSISTLKDARVTIGHGYSNETAEKMLTFFPSFLYETSAARIHFCAVFDFMQIARGGIDIYIQLTLELWDFAAAWCIIQEAGGELLDVEGKTLGVHSRSALATNSQLTAAALQLLKAPVTQ